MDTIKDEFQSDKAHLIKFNQDYSMFSIGTERGYKIYNTYPISDIHEKILYGGISLCVMSYRSNYLALVGGGKLPKYTNKKVILYNDAEDCIESEFKFTTPVKNVKFKKNLIFIVLEKKIYVFNVQNSQNIDSFDTIVNKNGMIAINGSPNKTIMAHPIQFNDQPDKGYVGIKNYKTNKYFPLLVHEETLSNMAMDYYGLLLATSNDKGTIIRIHSIEDKTLVYECRRGKEKAFINYLAFDVNYKYFGVTSDRGTIHIWKLNDIVEKNYSVKAHSTNDKKINNLISKTIKDDFVFIESENKNTIKEKEERDKYKIKKIKNYKSETSFGKIKINKQRCIFCFKPDDLVVIITFDGKYGFAQIAKKGGYFNYIEKELKKKMKE